MQRSSWYCDFFFDKVTLKCWGQRVWTEAQMGTTAAFHTWLNRWEHVSPVLEVTVKRSKIMKDLYNEPLWRRILQICAHGRRFLINNSFFPLFQSSYSWKLLDWSKNKPARATFPSIHHCVRLRVGGGSRPAGAGPEVTSSGNQSNMRVLTGVDVRSREPRAISSHHFCISTITFILTLLTVVTPGLKGQDWCGGPNASPDMPAFQTVRQLRGWQESHVSCEQKLFFLRLSRNSSSQWCQLLGDARNLYFHIKINSPQKKKVKRGAMPHLLKGLFIFSLQWGMLDTLSVVIGGFAVSGWWPELQIPPRSFKHCICSCTLKHDTNTRGDVKDVSAPSYMGVLEIIRPT